MVMGGIDADISSVGFSLSGWMFGVCFIFIRFYRNALNEFNVFHFQKWYDIRASTINTHHSTKWILYLFSIRIIPWQY